MDVQGVDYTDQTEEITRLPPGEETVSLVPLVSRSGAPACALIFHRTGTEPVGANWTREPTEMAELVPALLHLNEIRKQFGMPNEVAQDFARGIMSILPMQHD